MATREAEYREYRKKMEGMTGDMNRLVDDERYWKNLIYLVERRREVRGKQKRCFTK